MRKPQRLLTLTTPLLTVPTIIHTITVMNTEALKLPDKDLSCSAMAAGRSSFRHGSHHVCCLRSVRLSYHTIILLQEGRHDTAGNP